MTNWTSRIKQFENHLKLERGLAGNSVMAYIRDIKKLQEYIEQIRQLDVPPTEVNEALIIDFIQFLADLIMPSSQVRILAGVRAFYRFLIVEKLAMTDPTEYVHQPQVKKKLPEVLEVPEIEAMLAAIDLSTPEGTRNRAIIVRGCV
jgi:integrase/recombinase XerD